MTYGFFMEVQYYPDTGVEARIFFNGKVDINKIDKLAHAGLRLEGFNLHKNPIYIIKTNTFKDFSDFLEDLYKTIFKDREGDEGE